MADEQTSMREHMAKVFAAIAELQREGAVSSIRCEQCGALIHVKDLHTAWLISCYCGRYNDTLRGL